MPPSEPRIPPPDSPQAYKMVQDLTVADWDTRLPTCRMAWPSFTRAMVPGLGRMASPKEWAFARCLTLAEGYRFYLERMADMEALE